MSNKKEKEEYKPNRKERRTSQARMRKISSLIQKSGTAQMQKEGAKVRREKLARKIAKTRENTERRLALRRSIAEELGVSYKRVVLTGKLVEGEKAQYTVKPDRSSEAKRKAEEKQKRREKYARKMARKQS